MSYRTCAACGGRCHFHDTHWVCGRSYCGSEWDSDHDAVQYANPATLRENAVERVARREWHCVTSSGPNSADRSPSCTKVISPGEAYIEYLGESHPYRSGTRYCLACGVATWRDVAVTTIAANAALTFLDTAPLALVGGGHEWTLVGYADDFQVVGSEIVARLHCASDLEPVSVDFDSITWGDESDMEMIMVSGRLRSIVMRRREGM